MTQTHDTERQSAAAARLEVALIDGPAEFLALRDDWQKLYHADPESTVFLSWPWLNQAFQDNLYRWSVLVVRKRGAPGGIVAALPLKYRVHWSRSRQEFQTELEAGGRLLRSAYTGVLCHPEYETPALQALAARLARLPWTRLSLRYVAQSRRARIFTECFQEEDYSVKYKSYLASNKKIDNLICPQIELPAQFESYLDRQVSAELRATYQQIRRACFDSGDCHITESSKESFATDLAALAEIWQADWAQSKSASRARAMVDSQLRMLEAAQATGMLYMPVMRRNGEIRGAAPHLVDEKNGILHYILAGPPHSGELSFIDTALHFHSIAWTIRHDFICYDFCHGNAPFKYAFGAEDSQVVYFEIKRRACPPDLRFDSISTGEALARVQSFLQKGKHSEAEAACGQLAQLFS